MADKITYKDWNIEAITGYKPKTTFYMDFSIAEKFSTPKNSYHGIQDTYNRAFKGWKSNIKYITELYMVLNWKVLEHYQMDEKMAQRYQDLYDRLGDYINETNTFTKEEMEYFYRTTD